jgi:hypothetical protein
VCKIFQHIYEGINPDGGIIGVVKGYYSCVEMQGRCTLHCHMMIWLEGALNPNKIQNLTIVLLG